jgi:signal transduction histidine kinase
LLHADAHLRSLLSQRIHDQPKQQALRIRSLLAYWQQKLQKAGELEEKIAVQPVVEALGTVRQMSEVLEEDLRGLQRLVEDVYQRRSLGVQLHLEQVIWEDLPALHPESSLQVQADLAALAALPPDLEQTEEGIKLAEAISYTVTQALLNSYTHADATCAAVRTRYHQGMLEVSLSDDGCGFDPHAVSPEKTSLFKARLKAREAGGILTIQSAPRPQAQHGTTLLLRVPAPSGAHNDASDLVLEQEGRETAQDQHP